MSDSCVWSKSKNCVSKALEALAALFLIWIFDKSIGTIQTIYTNLYSLDAIALTRDILLVSIYQCNNQSSQCSNAYAINQNVVQLHWHESTTNLNQMAFLWIYWLSLSHSFDSPTELRPKLIFTTSEMSLARWKSDRGTEGIQFDL